MNLALPASNPQDRLLILWKAQEAVKQSDGGSANPLRGPLNPILRHLPRDRVAMEAEHPSRVAQVAFRPLKGPRDEHLFELPPGIVVENALVEHLQNELLQLIAHSLLPR